LKIVYQKNLKENKSNGKKFPFLLVSKMDKITTKEEIYSEVHKEFYNKNINKKSSDVLFDRLVKAMSCIEYNGLNEDFFEFQYDLDAELKDG
jgi:hypothetical protein